MKGMPNPMGCRWCGIDQRPHAQQWEQPTQRQIKQRMQARHTGRAEGVFCATDDTEHQTALDALMPPEPVMQAPGQLTLDDPAQS